MKLLIIAGPYEADRIRKAAVAAGFETVAVEPGESLSGWITASRPDLIVMAPQIVHPDPALALAKVRTVPRGRVPVFLVGDAAEEERLRNLAEGFFVRPIAPEILLEQARAILQPKPKPAAAQPDFERTEMGLGIEPPPRPARPQPDFERTEMGLGAAGVPARAEGPGASRGTADPSPSDRVTGRRLALPGSVAMGTAGPAKPSLKPLVAVALGGAPIAPARAVEPSRLLAELGANIDALLDAELEAAVAAAPRTRPAQSSTQEFGSELTRKADPALMADAARAPLKKKAGKANGGKAGKTSPGMPSAPPVAPRGADDPRARILRRHAVVEEGDYFAVLGVPRTASADDLRQAHAAILREMSASVVDEALARELSARIADVRAVADEALRVLTDERLRPRYAAHLPG